MIASSEASERAQPRRLLQAQCWCGARQALAALDRVRYLVDDTGQLFRCRSGGGRERPLPASKLASFVRRLQLGVVPSGFRAGFRAWAAEAAGMPRELALGHVGTSRFVHVHARSPLVDARRPFMQRWADHVAPEARKDG